MKKFYTLALAAFATMAMNAQIYVCGNFDGADHWTPEDPAAIGTLNDAGNWEVTLHDCASFKVSTVSGEWSTFDAAAFSINNGDVTEAFINDFFDVVAWGSDTSLPWKGDWTIEVTPDYKKMKLTTTTAKPSGPVDAYLVGAFTDTWAFSDTWKMTAVEMFKYTFHCEGATAIPADQEFKLAAQGYTYVNYSVGTAILADGEPCPASYNIMANMFFEEAFEGDIYLELINGYNQDAEVTFTPISAGVESVAIENNAPAEYFNLQGVRVAQPENGLYIVRRGNEVSKVLVK